MENQIKKKIKTLFVLVICLLLSKSYSQNIDSLYKVFNSKEKHDTDRVKALVKVAQNFMFVEPDSARHVAELAVKFSKEKKLMLWETRALKAIGVSYYALSNHKQAIPYIEESIKKLQNTTFQSDLALAYNIAGVIYSKLSEYPKAIDYHKKAIEIATKLKDENIIGSNYVNMGIVYKTTSDFPKALNCYISALKLYDKDEDSPAREKCLGNIATVYQLMNNFKDALKYYEQSLSLNEKTKDKRQRASTLLNIGNNYLLQKQFEESKKYFYEGLICAQQTQNVYIIAAIYNSFGEMFADQNQLDSALKYLKLTAELLHNSGNRQDEAISLNAQSEVHFRKGDIKKSIELSLKALKIAEEIKILEDESKIRFQLYKSYKGANNFKESLIHFERYKQILDSLSKKENIEEITKRQLNYEFDKKTTADSLRTESEKKIKELSYAQNIKEQKIFSFIGVLGFIVAIIISLIIYRGYRQKKKNNTLLEEKNLTITNQKNEVTHQKDIIEEKHKEITDSINYAERIQRSFLASKSFLDENLKEYFVFFQPKDVVSGDFYWASKLSNNNFSLIVADSTGHGVPGAIMSILNISSLEKAVESGAFEPSEILNYTRKIIIERLKKDGSLEGGKDGMDCSCIVLNQDKTILTYSAANNPVWIVRNVNTNSVENELELIELSPDKMPVGKHDKDHISFTQNIFNLQKGDVIYTLTDGMPDQFGGPKGKKFMYKKLKELLISISQKQMHEQKQLLINNLNDWRGDLEQVDDVCIVGIKI